MHSCGWERGDIAGDEKKIRVPKEKNGHSWEINGMCACEAGRKAEKRKERNETVRKGGREKDKCQGTVTSLLIGIYIYIYDD